MIRLLLVSCGKTLFSSSQTSLFPPFGAVGFWLVGLGPPGKLAIAPCQLHLVQSLDLRPLKVHFASGFWRLQPEDLESFVSYKMTTFLRLVMSVVSVLWTWPLPVLKCLWKVTFDCFVIKWDWDFNFIYFVLKNLGSTAQQFSRLSMCTLRGRKFSLHNRQNLASMTTSFCSQFCHIILKPHTI